MWKADFKKQFISTQEEVFSWNNFCVNFTNSSARSETDLNLDIAKKHSLAQPKIVHLC